MQQGPFWEANWFSASQEIPCILWNLKAHYCVYKGLPPVPILSQLNLVHTTTSHFLKIHLNIIHSCTSGSFKWLFPSGFPTKTVYTPLLTLLRATCLAYHILDIITQTILGEEYRSLRSSLWRFLHSPVTSPLLDPNILLKHPQPTLLPQYVRSCFTPIQNRQNYSYVYLEL